MRRISLVLAVSVLGLGLFPRLALCIGAEGHQAIELATAACCDPATHSGQHGTRGRENGCAPSCTDMPLTPYVLASRFDDAGPLAPHWDAANAPTPLLATPSLKAPAISLLDNGSVPVSQPPRALRTTVDLR